MRDWTGLLADLSDAIITGVIAGLALGYLHVLARNSQALVIIARDLRAREMAAPISREDQP